MDLQAPPRRNPRPGATKSKPAATQSKSGATKSKTDATKSKSHFSAPLLFFNDLASTGRPGDNLFLSRRLSRTPPHSQASCAFILKNQSTVLAAWQENVDFVSGISVTVYSIIE
jgi:hypothetical protein